MAHEHFFNQSDARCLMKDKKPFFCCFRDLVVSGSPLPPRILLMGSDWGGSSGDENDRKGSSAAQPKSQPKAKAPVARPKPQSKEDKKPQTGSAVGPDAFADSHCVDEQMFG